MEKQLALPIAIREAGIEDCSRLLELVKELAHFERAPNEVSITLDEFREAGFGEKPVWKAFVAEAAGSIEGFALYYLRFSTWKGTRLYLEDLYVTEKLRGQGLGKKLFDRIVSEAQEKGFKGMNWQVLDWNSTAIDFYKKYDANLDGGWLNASLSQEQLQAAVVPFTGK